MSVVPSSPFDTNRTVLGKVEKCIYCKKPDVPLSEEHIIPYGLNGNQVLLEASCSECSKITSAFEGDVLRRAFILPRVGFKMRSRHGKNKDKKITVVLEQDSNTSYIEIPAEDCPILFMLPIFMLPETLDDRPHQSGIQGTGAFYSSEIRGIPKEKLRKKYGPGKIAVNISYSPNSFARMLAKIAYGFAVAHFGIDDIEDLGIVSAIMGKTDDIGKWVGCITSDEKFAPNTVLHSWQFGIKSSYEIDAPKETVIGQLSYKISLFSLFNTPEYTVVVGNVRNLASKISLPI